MSRGISRSATVAGTSVSQSAEPLAETEHSADLSEDLIPRRPPVHQISECSLARRITAPVDRSDRLIHFYFERVSLARPLEIEELLTLERI